VKASNAQVVSAVAQFKEMFNVLNRDTLSESLLSQTYTDDLVFRDPLHHIEGMADLIAYFENVYENVGSICFDWLDESLEKDRAYLRWKMYFTHPRLNRGQSVAVDGTSILRVEDGKVCDHRDFFDAGQMLYEHIPALGFLIRKLKQRLV